MEYLNYYYYITMWDESGYAGLHTCSENEILLHYAGVRIPGGDRRRSGGTLVCGLHGAEPHNWWPEQTGILDFERHWNESNQSGPPDGADVSEFMVCACNWHHRSEHQRYVQGCGRTLALSFLLVSALSLRRPVHVCADCVDRMDKARTKHCCDWYTLARPAIGKLAREAHAAWFALEHEKEAAALVQVRLLPVEELLSELRGRRDGAEITSAVRVRLEEVLKVL